MASASSPSLCISYDIVEFVRPLVVFENAVWFSEDNALGERAHVVAKRGADSRGTAPRHRRSI